MITRNTDYSIQRLRGLSTDTKPTDVPNGSEFREMDTGKDFMYDEASGDWKEQPKKGGGAGMKLTKVTIINNRTETTLRHALSIYGVCDENGFAKQDILRGGGRSTEVYVPNGNPETKQRWPKPCTMIFYADSNIPMNISSDIEVSTLDYSAEGKQQYILSFFADGNPITITVIDG